MTNSKIGLGDARTISFILADCIITSPLSHFLRFLFGRAGTITSSSTYIRTNEFIIHYLLLSILSIYAYQNTRYISHPSQLFFLMCFAFKISVMSQLLHSRTFGFVIITAYLRLRIPPSKWNLRCWRFRLDHPLYSPDPFRFPAAPRKRVHF